MKPITIELEFNGKKFAWQATIEVASWGTMATYNDPGDGPEWEATSILRGDEEEWFESTLEEMLEDVGEAKFDRAMEDFSVKCYEDERYNEYYDDQDRRP